MACFCVLTAQNRYIILPPNTLRSPTRDVSILYITKSTFFCIARMGEGLVSFFECKESVGSFFDSLSELFALILYLSIIMILHHII